MAGVVRLEGVRVIIVIMARVIIVIMADEDGDDDDDDDDPADLQDVALGGGPGPRVLRQVQVHEPDLGAI